MMRFKLFFIVTTFLFFIWLIVAINVMAQSKTGFYKDVKTNVLLPKEAGENVIKLFRFEGSIIAVSATAIISRWNTNPRQFDAGNGGKTEDSGSYFLFAYWMGRYFGYWE